jgi:hypothetical protein
MCTITDSRHAIVTSNREWPPAVRSENLFRSPASAQAQMRKIDRNLLPDGKNRRFYLVDKIEDFFGLPRRKLLYRRDGLSHRRAAASHMTKATISIAD